MKLELLGETSIPEAISYIDNGYVYIGKLVFLSVVLFKNRTKTVVKKIYTTG